MRHARSAKGPSAPRMADGPFEGLLLLRVLPGATGGQEALASVFSAAFSAGLASAAFAAAGFGAGLAAS